MLLVLAARVVQGTGRELPTAGGVVGGVVFCLSSADFSAAAALGARTAFPKRQ